MSAINSQPSIFSRMMSGEVAVDAVYEDEHCIVINDIHPQAPVHMLVVPRKPLKSLLDAEENDEQLLGHLMLVASKMAKQAGLEKGFRLIANNGKAAGQTVFHLHFHVLGGRAYSEASLSKH